MSTQISAVATRTMPVPVAQFGTGSPLLYLHDVLFDLVTPDGEVPEFVELLGASHTVYAPALPGFHDLKQLDGLHTVDQYVSWLDDLIDALGLDRPNVVGTGFGGWLAAELATTRPDRFGSLTLINAFGLRVEGHPIGRFFYAAAPNGLEGRKPVRQLVFADPDGDIAQRALPDHPEIPANERFFTNVHAASRIGWAPPNFYNPTLARRLDRIAVPTHVVWGEANSLVGLAHAAAYESGIAGATLTQVEGAGQAITVERPEQLAKAVTGFIAELDDRR